MERICAALGCSIGLSGKRSNAVYCSVKCKQKSRVGRPPIEDLPGEEWRDIPSWEGRYQVSNLGRVKSVSFASYKGAALLSYRDNKRGYWQVTLYERPRVEHLTIHKLVMWAFVGSRPPGMEICHGDGNRKNNSLSNLRYGTSTENKQDAIKHGTWTHGETHPEHKLTTEEVSLIQELYSSGEYTQKNLGNKFGVCRSLVSMIVANKRRVNG